MVADENSVAEESSFFCPKSLSTRSNEKELFVVDSTSSFGSVVVVDLEMVVGSVVEVDIRVVVGLKVVVFAMVGVGLGVVVVAGCEVVIDPTVVFALSGSGGHWL